MAFSKLISLPYRLSKSFFQPFLAKLDHFDVIILAFLIVYSSKHLSYIRKIIRQKGFEGLIKRIKSRLISFAVKNIQKYKEKVSKEMEKMENDISKDINSTDPVPKTYEIPLKGINSEELSLSMYGYSKKDCEMANSGRISGGIYIDRDGKYEKNVKEFAKEFMFHNPLHFDVFTACRHMEAEILSMTGKLFGMNDVFGTITTGGTESICMCMLAYREWAKDNKGITNPEIIIPITAHSAFDKAAHYFGIDLIKIPLDNNWKVNLEILESKITNNTICIVGSMPNFPHGICDNIEKLSEIALKYEIGLHVDCCLGGFLLPFAGENNIEIPKISFSIKGITSFSIDHHKYGLAPKGISCNFYRTKSLRQYQYFAVSDWPGGIYATPTLAGSRSGCAVSGAWFAMMNNGLEIYKENAKKIYEAVKNITLNIEKINELKIIGEPKVCVVSFTSKNPESFNMYSLHFALSKKGWNLSALQNPPAIHISVTIANVTRWKDLINDILECINEIKNNPADYKGGMCALYGTASMIPDGSMIEHATKLVLDCAYKI